MQAHRKDGEVENRPKSIGGRIFDGGTYGGIAWLGTFIAGLIIAFKFKYGTGAEWYERTAVRAEQHWLNWLPEKWRHGAAKDGLMTSILMMGGNLMLLPVAGLEYCRTSIITGLNRMFEDPTDPESIKDAPPQTIGSIIKGRALAWGVVFFSIVGVNTAFPETMKTYFHEFGKNVCKVLRKPVEIMKEGKLAYSNTYHYGEIAALDVFATTASAALLYVGSHIFARRAQHRREEQQEQKALHHPPANDTTPLPIPAAANDNPKLTISHATREGGKVVATPAMAAELGA